jgi:ubiquitin-protein ligase
MAYESPRDRRLRTDFQAMTRLKEDSSILDFQCFDKPPQRYLITFNGKGLSQAPNSDSVDLIEFHQCEIRLGASYPRNKPDLKWKTSIFHPNISALGQVCLGGYGTNWVPSLNLDELCEMLWDMIRLANFDTKSPYNYKAARWAEQQAQYHFPLDDRSLKDLVAQRRAAELRGETFEEPRKEEPRQEDPLERLEEEGILFIGEEAPSTGAGEDSPTEEIMFYIGDD